MNTNALLTEISDMAESAARGEHGAQSWENFLNYLRSTLESLAHDEELMLEIILDLSPAADALAGAMLFEALNPVLASMGRIELTVKRLAGQPAECVNFILTARQLPLAKAS